MLQLRQPLAVPVSARRLVIGGSHGPSARLLPGLITSFRQKYPGVQIVHRTGTSTEVQKLLVDGAVELALVSNPMKSASLTIENYGEERLLLVAAPSHAAAKLGTLSTAQLATADLLIGDTKDDEDQTIKILRRRLPANLKLQIGARFDNAGALKSAVKAGGGIGVLYYDMVVEELCAGTLKGISVSGVNLAGFSHLVYLKTHSLSPLANQFIEHMREQHQSKPRLVPSLPQHGQ